jgi:GNAT superfamily N-acetyltransferase
MKNQIEVRPARAEDKNAIVAFCQNTFSWGDYIPDAWDDWLVDPSGRILVGVIGHQPVGMIHVAFLGNGEAWMAGMRVHPDFRRQGVGTAVDAAGRAYARECGCHIARLATSIKNIAAQKTLATQGYTRIAQFNEWSAKPVHRRFSVARVATADDLPEILARWDHSEIRAASRGLLPDPDWRWTGLTEARLHEQNDAAQVRRAPRGFTLVSTFDEKDWSGLGVHALVGDEETVCTLALAARGEAYYRGYPRVEAIVADHALLNAALESVGYRREGGMLIYEQML